MEVIFENQAYRVGSKKYFPHELENIPFKYTCKSKTNEHEELLCLRHK